MEELWRLTSIVSRSNSRSNPRIDIVYTQLKCLLLMDVSFTLKPTKRKEKDMKINKLKKRLQKNRTMTTISLRIPEDVVDDLKNIAPRLGFSGYQPLIRAYIGQGLRVDLERLSENAEMMQLVESLRRHGVKEKIIASAMAEVKGSAEAA